MEVASVYIKKIILTDFFLMARIEDWPSQFRAHSHEGSVFSESRGGLAMVIKCFLVT